jgi:dihydrofolate synthase / folylpolyglutamate synthase
MAFMLNQVLTERQHDCTTAGLQDFDTMTYKETIEFLYSQLPVYHRIGKAAYKANLDNTLALDKYFDHPHRKYATIHIAGTNGKGSVSHILASVLQEAGYKTALYTSPHLNDYRERIRINGEMIAEEEVISFVEKNIGIITDLKPSFFEMSVALAFSYFAIRQADVAVVETGLGGRLDSTNIINPVLSVITNIGFDHMDLLGNTIPAIASEKAGIIKNGVPVVIGETSELTRDLFLRKAEETGSEIVFADTLYNCSLKDFDSGVDSREFELDRIPAGIKIKGESGLGGDYQAKNIQTVAASVDFLGRNFEISVNNLTAGIEKVIQNTGLSGRWQIIGREPLIVCDTGHNADGLRYAMSQIAKVNKKRLHIVIGFVNDKDLSQVLPLLPENADYYFTRASVQRALDPLVLRDKANQFRLFGNVYRTVPEAFMAAKMNASGEDMIFIGGSTFVVAEVL